MGGEIDRLKWGKIWRKCLEKSLGIIFENDDKWSGITLNCWNFLEMKLIFETSLKKEYNSFMAGLD